MSSTSTERPQRRKRSPKRRGRNQIAHYLGILREHKLGALLAFLTVFGLMSAKTLYSVPTYTSSATVRILDAERSGKLVEDIAALEGASTLETEMQMVRSRAVAKLAAKIYSGVGWRLEEYEKMVRQTLSPEQTSRKKKGEDDGKDSGSDDDSDAGSNTEQEETWKPTKEREEPDPPPFVEVMAVEEHGYRPLETTLRSFGFGRRPVDVRVHTDYIDEETLAGLNQTFRFSMRADGRSASVERLGDPSPAEMIEDFKLDKVVKAFDRRFRFASNTPLNGRVILVYVRGLGALAAVFKRSGTVQSIGYNTGLIAVGATSSWPSHTARMADALAEGYLLHRWKNRYKTISAGRDWTKRRLWEIQRSITQAERNLDKYMYSDEARNLSERAKSLIDTSAKLKLDLEAARAKLTSIRWEQQQLAANKATGPIASANDLQQRLIPLGARGIDSITSKLASDYVETKRQLDALLKEGSLTEADSTIKNLRISLGLINNELPASIAALRENQSAAIHERIRALEAEIKNIRSRRDDTDAMLGRVPDVELKLVELRRKVETPRSELGQLLDRNTEFNLATSTLQDTALLVDSALVPTRRISPQLMNKAVVAFVLGLGLALAVALLLDQLNRKIRGPGELEDGLDLPVHAAIPDHKTVPRKERPVRGSTLVTLTRPRSVISETYRTLRANVRYADAERDMKAIAITSAQPAEGKTVTSLNLAVAMAQAGDRVLLVDADLRRPTSHKHLDIERAPGLTDCLEAMPESDDYRPFLQTVPTKGKTLHVIGAGTSHANPGALLDSDRFRRLIAQFKESYDQVLFDVPPVLAVADSASFFRELDGILLLVRYGKSSLDVVQSAADRVERLGGTLFGAIFNGFDARKPDRSRYGYSVYGYYGYGKDYKYRIEDGAS